MHANTFVRRMTALACLSLAAGALSVTVGCAPTVYLESREQIVLSPQGVSALSVHTHNGAVKAAGVADAAGRIVVDVDKRAGGIGQDDARKALDAIEIVTAQDGGTQTLAWRWPAAHPAHWQATVAFDIHMPADFHLSVETHNGGVSAANVNGDVTLVTHNGGVTVRGGGEDLVVRTHNGGINVQSPAKNVQLRTHNGRISAQLDCAGPLGGVVISHNGGVDVDLHDSASARLSCSTHNGRVSFSHGGTELSGYGEVLVDVGGGGEELHVETHNGSIKVH